jgi:hypothetical protein
MPRKAIALIAVNNVLTALCNDGTVWQLDTQWRQLPAIPQNADARYLAGATGPNADCIHGEADEHPASEHDTRLDDDDLAGHRISGEDKPAT